MLLAWLTLIGAAIGVRERTHFTLHVLRLRQPHGQAIIDRVHYVLVAVIGALASWYGVKLCLLNRTLVTPGLRSTCRCSTPRRAVGGALLVVYALSMIVIAAAARSDSCHWKAAPTMLLLLVAAIFVVLILFSMPIVFALGVVGVAGLFIGGYDMQVLLLEHGVGLAELGAARHPRLRLRRRPDGEMRHEPRAGRLRPRPGRLGQGRARHVGDRGRLLLLRHLRLEDGRGLGARLDPDAAAHQGRLQARGLGLADRRRHGDGHAGAARHLHDRDRPGHQHLGGGAVPRAASCRPPPSWSA